MLLECFVLIEFVEYYESELYKRAHYSYFHSYSRLDVGSGKPEAFPFRGQYTSPGQPSCKTDEDRRCFAQRTQPFGERKASFASPAFS